MSSMTEKEWRGTLNQILYVIGNRRALDDQLAQQIAEGMIEQLAWPSGADQYYEAITHALQAEQLLTATNLSTDHPDGDIRLFLVHIADQLDLRRPWPNPRFTKLSLERWPEFASATPIARIKADPKALLSRVRKRFDQVETETGPIQVLILQMQTGETIALRGLVQPSGPEVAHETGTTLLSRENDVLTTIANFRELARLGEADVIALPGSGT